MAGTAERHTSEYTSEKRYFTLINNKKISFIGLGVMGFPMAGHLARASGCAVTVYNRSLPKAERWAQEHGGAIAAAPAQAAHDAGMIFLCVGNDHDVREVVGGAQGILAGASEGAIIVDHTTTSATLAREMYALCRTHGCHFIDAPVSGGQAGAEKGQLTVMCGGDEVPFLDAENILRSCYAKEIVLMGSSGSGQLSKMVNQICIAGVVQGLAEGLDFGQRAGLDMDKLLGAIGKGAAQSWQMDNRARTMVRGEFDFGFAVDWMIKDLGIAAEEAGRNGATLEMTQAVLEYYRELSAQGDGRLDTSSLIRRLRSSP